MLYLAMGILGATVMPHNLYLHSGIVQTRTLGDTVEEKQESLRFATINSTIALLFALLVNASILILSAAAFHANGKTDIVDLSEAHGLLDPLLGSSLAPILFALALIGVRTKFICHRHHGRSDCDGRVLAAQTSRRHSPLDHPRHRHCAGGRCRNPLMAIAAQQASSSSVR